ncbi:uncharacterized protein LOC117597862 isoform X2 [Pangasianodon hypophthalmus]|uniref:uncharacterized protein LOC117597862 isoform X2 n=1 Tax=Pangasianodon hypophthalmus TaxID=310915 RepID=UPI00147FE830|nr:uncharacterized protein LOC117597862 isoform X2 [Pangasianodon hypophthalmus]
MCLIRKLFISCVVMLWMNLTVSHAPPLCCVQDFTNKSAKHTVSTSVCKYTTWNRDETPIKDEHDSVNKKIVLAFGPNWILLNGKYSGINFRCMDPDKWVTTVNCTDPCKPGEDNPVTEDPSLTPPSNEINVSVLFVITIVIIIITIIVIIVIVTWQTGCYGRCGEARLAHSGAHHANGVFRSVNQEDQQESSL